MSTATIISGATIWTPDRVIEEGSVRIEDGVIVALNDASAPPGCEIIDARGLTLIPGLVDTHSHHREPGFTHKEDIASATAAAAMGGVTTSIGMPNVQPPVTDAATYQATLKHYARSARVDYNIHPAATNPDALPALAELGALGFKVWMVEDTKRTYPHMPGLGVHDDADLLRVFEAVQPTGRPLLVHPHNQSLMSLFEQRYWDQGRTKPLDYGLAQREYTGIMWDTAIQTLLTLQKAVGTRLHVLHLVTTAAVHLIEEAKRARRQVTSEVNPFGLFLGASELIEAKGPYVMGRWVPDEVKSALWAGLRSGTIDVIGTDHAPHAREEKERGWENMWKAPSGTPQLQDYLSMLLTEVNAARLMLDDVVRATAVRPAQIFGIFPKKGTIAPGSDADLVLVDMNRSLTITDGDAVSKCGWTPYHGVTVTGIPVATMVRGKFVMRDRVVVGEPGFGRHVTRTPGPDA